MKNNNNLSKREKRLSLKELMYTIKLRNTLKKQTIELIKITKTECERELERRSRKYD